jgi:two-component system OmpR family response regulator/two-component system response regulator QseB
MARTKPETGAQRVLLVEDEISIAEGLSELLGELGIEVTTVARGREAPEAFRQCLPDLVILDIGLPDMSGIEVGAELRRMRPSLPIIFSTGHGGSQSISELETGGPTRLLRKPFEIDDLIAVIAELERHL